MSKRCYHCGEPLSEKDKVCPRCGADAHESRKPKTIYELRVYCAQKHVPLADIRFFIDEDYRGPKAFGIYQDDEGQFVVYKNKADGTRAIRYRGPDEAHAVNEIYEKMKDEVELRRAKKRGGVTRSSVTRSPSRPKKPGTIRTVMLGAIISMLTVAVMIVVIAFIALRGTPRRGYYHYGSDTYYYYHDWYRFDEDDWYPAEEIPQELEEDYRDYRTDDYDVPAFEDTEWYDYEDSRYDSDDDDYDDDDDWDDDDWGDDDWDDWDTDDTDWDSDW